MAGCENCSIRESSTYSECDLIGTFSQLCIAMPNMPQCSQYSRMCAATKDLPFCATSESTIGRNAPTMKMFFHTGFSDYILFETWVPRSAAQFSIAWILVFLAAAGYEALQVFVSFKELHWAKKDCKSNTVLDNSAFGEVTQTKAVDNDAISLQSLCGASGGLTGIKQSFYRAILRMVSTAIGYSLMLVAMSFNVGLFIAVITGFGFGTFVFVPMIRIKLANALVTPTYATTECH